jgi:hypothetical protein
MKINLSNRWGTHSQITATPCDWTLIRVFSLAFMIGLLDNGIHLDILIHLHLSLRSGARTWLTCLNLSVVCDNIIYDVI